MLKEIGIIIEKELKRVITDRRLVITTFVVPCISIFVIYSMMGAMIGRFMNDVEAHVPVVYIQGAPKDFVNMAKKESVHLNVLPENFTDAEALKKRIKEGQVDLFIHFDRDFSEKVVRFESEKILPEVTTYYNPSEDYSRKARHDVFDRLFAAYEKKLLGDRLGNPAYAKVFEVDNDEKASEVFDEKKASGKGLGNLLPFLITIFLFSGAMSLGLESIAGEKERGTMATLLVTPVRRDAIAYGKIISLGIFAFLSSLSSFAGIMASMPFASKMFMEDRGATAAESMSLPFSAGDFAMLLGIMLCMVAIFVAIICALSLYAKSVKEAGTYVTPIYMVVMIAGIMTMFNNSEVPFWQYLIPIYGGIMSIKSIFLFQYSLAAFGVHVLVSFITVVGLVYLIKVMFNDERIIFNQ